MSDIISTWKCTPSEVAVACLIKIYATDDTFTSKFKNELTIFLINYIEVSKINSVNQVNRM